MIDRNDKDKWLKDLFAGQTPLKPDSGFETRLMLRIAAVEEKALRKKRLQNLFIGMACSLVAASGLVAAFIVFGWDKSLAASMNHLVHQFTSMKMDMLTVVPVTAVFMLLIIDLFVRKLIVRK